jgi:O-antigen/teichoic acid export membrane protein
MSRTKGALAVLLAQAIVLLLGWITHPIVARLLGRESYGVYGIVLSVQTTIGIFLSLGLPVAIARFSAQNREQATHILRQGLRWQILFAGGLT